VGGCGWGGGLVLWGGLFRNLKVGFKIIRVEV